MGDQFNRLMMTVGVTVETSQIKYIYIKNEASEFYIHSIKMLFFKYFFLYFTKVANHHCGGHPLFACLFVDIKTDLFVNKDY